MTLKNAFENLAVESKQDSILTELKNKANLNDTQPVSVENIPANIATSDSQAAILNELEKKADVTETQPVSANALPLPTGASTAALQTAANTKLDGIATTQATTNSKLDTIIANTNLTTSKTIYDEQGLVTYIGKAAPGTATSAANWQIRKIDETSGTVITWANGGISNQIWDNRASLSYI